MKNFLSFVRGLTSVEYALMASLVVILTFATLQIMGEAPSGNLFRTAVFG